MGHGSTLEDHWNSIREAIELFVMSPALAWRIDGATVRPRMA
jgi:hypothetical protein